VSQAHFDERHWKVVKLLATIVKRKCLVALRRKVPPLSVAPDDLAAAVNPVVACDGDPMVAGDVSLGLNEAVENTLDGMTTLQRNILEIVYDANDPRSLDDIALACDCSLTIVQDTIHEFENKLRRFLRDRQ
jgi:DNA-directed RNA polymerase specialized sigma24 family protein